MDQKNSNSKFFLIFRNFKQEYKIPKRITRILISNKKCQINQKNPNFKVFKILKFNRSNKNPIFKFDKKSKEF